MGEFSQTSEAPRPVLVLLGENPSFTQLGSHLTSCLVVIPKLMVISPSDSFEMELAILSKIFAETHRGSHDARLLIQINMEMSVLIDDFIVTSMLA
jgi:hypothetical protein